MLLNINGRIARDTGGQPFHPRDEEDARQALEYRMSGRLPNDRRQANRLKSIFGSPGCRFVYNPAALAVKSED